jgi:hypothetical protein
MERKRRSHPKKNFHILHFEAIVAGYPDRMSRRRPRGREKERLPGFPGSLFGGSDAELGGGG